MSAKPKFIRNTPEEEAAIQAGIALDPENPEWTEEDFDEATRPGLPFPPTLTQVQAAPKARQKVAISIRLDRDVVEKLQASGPNWQSRVNDLLRRYG
jgi:uncharacterized protein (DUF4415 family)